MEVCDSSHTLLGASDACEASAWVDGGAFVGASDVWEVSEWIDGGVRDANRLELSGQRSWVVWYRFLIPYSHASSSTRLRQILGLWTRLDLHTWSINEPSSEVICQVVPPPATYPVLARFIDYPATPNILGSWTRPDLHTWPINEPSSELICQVVPPPATAPPRPTVRTWPTHYRTV
jgi:hypothetical protein